MDMRELKALELAARAKIEWNGQHWSVPSQTTGGSYRVTLTPESCACEDFSLRQAACKHIIAARLVCERDFGMKGPEIDTDAVPKRPTYKQDWMRYNQAQMTEKDRFQELLADLLKGIDEPAQPKTGRRRTLMRDMIFASCLKVFTTVSSRRFACDLAEAHGRGHLSHLMHSVQVCAFLESEAMTPYLNDLIARSALPLRCVETTFAPDSTGFSTSRFVKWFDEKYGVERSGHAWCKAHAMTGTKTNIITAAVIDGPTAGDSPQLEALLKTTAASGFRMGEVCADKAYLSRDNLDLITAHGAVPYIPFKSNSVPGEAGSLWERMFLFYNLHRDQFLARYHQRSNVESTFSMVKAKFRDNVRSKSDTAMKNEVLCKFLCHNVVVVHQSAIELGIEVAFWPEERGGEDSPRDVLPFRVGS